MTAQSEVAGKKIRSKYKQPRCKYGHLFSGENLLLRERTITQRRYKGKIYKYPHTVYIERVCRTCLNEQRARYILRQKANK